MASLVPAPGEGVKNYAQAFNSVASALSRSRQGSSSSTDWTNAAAYNYRTMQEQNAFNAREAAKNREWQEHMSNTSYQRAVKDMLAAGINPILAYTQGGRSTPSGSSRSGSARTIGAEAYSSSFGISGLTEGLGQIIGAIESLWGSSRKANETIVNVSTPVMNTVQDVLHGYTDHVAAPYSQSRQGGFGGSSKGGSFKGGLGTSAKSFKASAQR